MKKTESIRVVITLEINVTATEISDSGDYWQPATTDVEWELEDKKSEIWDEIYKQIEEQVKEHDFE